MKIARPKKVEINLTVLIVISLILLTACGSQPITEPTQTPTTAVLQATQIILPTGTATATNTPPPPASPTPEARMTVEQQKAYLEAHKIPYIVKPNGELQFDFMKMYTETATIKVGHQETLGADLAAAAAEYDTAFPEPASYKPEDFTEVRWGSTPSEEQQRTIYKIVVLSDDFKEKRTSIEPIGALLATIDNEQYAFFYMRSPLTDPAEIIKNDGKPYITYWILSYGSTFTLDATRPTETLNDISQGKLQFSFSTIFGSVEDLKSAPEPDVDHHIELYKLDEAWHALRTNFNSADGHSVLQLKNDVLLEKLENGMGFSAEMQDSVILGDASRPESIRERSSVENLPSPAFP